MAGNPNETVHQSGVWCAFSSAAKPGQMYKFVIYGENGRVEHCDPFGFGMELRPGACSIIRDLSQYQFTDEKWMEQRSRGYDKSLNIYELHLEECRTQIKNFLLKLPERERLVIELRFGLNDNGTVPPKSLADVGNILGLSKERVRQIEERALLRLRKMPNISSLYDYLDI